MTSTQSPARTSARSVSMCIAVLPASVSAAEVSKLTDSGNATTQRAGTQTCSANPPSHWMPSSLPFKQTESSPRRQNSQVPQKRFDCTARRSPMRHWSTSAPSARISPATSLPPMRGNATGVGKSPCSNQRSRRFTPHAHTRTMTSSAAGVGSGTSPKRNCPGVPWARSWTAFMATD